MTKMTTAQKMLRPILNWTVETFFPEGAFFGNDYLRGLKADTTLTEKWGSVEMACAMLISDRLRELGAEHATFEASEVSSHGVNTGSWRITVEKIPTPHPPAQRRER